MQSKITIVPSRTEYDQADVARLFSAYADAIGIDLAYQDFATELTMLPGKYAPPSGELLLARDAMGAALGCVALRVLPDKGCCEMKRLYVTPKGRGLGLGRALAQAVIDVAQQIGYHEMRLDTLPFMKEAIALYADLGFVPTTAYYGTPYAETLFFARALQPAVVTRCA